MAHWSADQLEECCPHCIENGWGLDMCMSVVATTDIHSNMNTANMNTALHKKDTLN